MNNFKVIAKIAALVTAIVALLCFANVKEEQKYIIVYGDERL